MNVSALSDDTSWSVNPCSWKAAAKIAEELGIPQVVGMVLAGRGMSDPSEARDFLECTGALPDPFLFADMPGAVAAIISAVDQQRKIVVHGDYDADGVTATALLVGGLRDLGAQVDWYLPSRFKEGYGLSAAAVNAMADDGASLLITVDCGVNYPNEVALARQLGLEVVVVDHHQPGPTLPECHLIHQCRGRYPDGELCGVGLALKVLHALHMQLFGAAAASLPPELASSLDLVAIGTVADLSALRGENRYYVREGLRLLNLGQRVGLRALSEVASCAGAIDSGAIAFRLAPRLNAAGRLADATPPLRLLLTEDEHEAKQLAARLHDMNGERQDLERTMFEAAQRQVSALESLPTILVLAGSDWHEGVVGIVASRMVDLYQRPTIMLSLHDGVAKGSGRSIPAYNLLSGIDANGRLLTVYGGHAQAAGLTMKADDLDEFRRGMEEHASSALSAADLVPRYRADAVITSEELSDDTAGALAMLEPFGSGNPRPRLLVVDALLHKAESTRNGLHLRCTAEVGGVRIPAIGFGMGEKSGQIVGGQVYVAGAQLKADEWRGSLRPQLILDRVAPLEPIGDGPHAQACFTAGAARAGGAPGQTEPVPPAAAPWPVSARDIRDRPGRLTAVAQVLASGESVVMFTISAARTLTLLRERLPMGAVAGGEPVCVTCGSNTVDEAGLRTARLTLVEWGSSVDVWERVKDRVHVVVFDPPYRREQAVAVSALSDAGATLHLMYGRTEREQAAALLRYLVHPRFAMVCMYNAMRSGDESGDGRLVQAARALAWEQAQVELGQEEWRRAQTILAELSLDTSAQGKAKLDARSNLAYQAAEADYEECVRTCLIL